MIHATPALNLAIPEIAQALLNVGAATTYDDFSEATMAFLKETIEFNSAEVRLHIFDAKRDQAVHVNSSFSTKRVRTPEEMALRKRIAPAFAFMDRNPSTTVYRGQNHTMPRRRELERLQFFKEFMIPEGWHDNLGMAFWDKTGLSSWVFINRDFNQPAFNDGEVQLFQQIYPYFASSLRRINLVANEQAIRANLESSLLDLPIATVVLDWQLNVEQANHAAHRLGDSWEHGVESARLFKPTGRLRIAPEVLAACRELRDLWSNDPKTTHCELRRIVAHPTVVGMQATITLLRPNALRLGTPSFLIRFTEVLLYADRVNPGNRAQALARLSPAERDVALLVAGGETNKAIAEKLGKSVMTVKNQVHTILEKVGVANRTRLSAALSG